MKKLFTKEKPLQLFRVLAFTLAEVIIVMGIIGIVAEMTVPGLVNSAQQQETLSRLKKTVSVLNQAILRNTNENIPLDSPTGVDATDSATLANYFTPYLKIAKTCTSTDTDCGLINVWCLHHRDAGISMPNTYPRYILKDGTSIGFWGNTSVYKVYVDVNGPTKNPNRMGYDVFMIRINPSTPQRQTTVLMYASWIDLNTYNTDPQGCDTPPYQATGQYCFYRIMFDNWQINYW